MKSYIDTRRRSTIQVGAAALLLAVMLIIPQLSWADHASDHAYGQFDGSATTSAAFLASNPEIGAFTRSFAGLQTDVAASASSARWAALGASYADAGAAFLTSNPEIGAFTRSFAGSQPDVAASASSARWAALGTSYADSGAAFLASNPELGAYRNFVVQQVCSAPGLGC